MYSLSPYEGTLALAEESGIIVDTMHRSSVVPAAALTYNGVTCVFIDETQYVSEVERKYVVIHEIGHCKTGMFYNDNTPYFDRQRIEYRVNMWEVPEHIPFEEYCMTILDGCLEEWEQSERWNVPQWFVPTVHRVYESTRWDDVQKLKRDAAELWSYV